jgi:hypothetical protein
MRRALMLAGCGMLGVGLCACESTEQESAQIARENAAAAHTSTRPAAKPAGRGHAPTRSHGPQRHSTHPSPAKGPSTP